MSFKSDFPLFANHPELVYLDSAATVQKPQAVIDEVNNFVTHSYSNVHRGLYDLSQEAEEIFRECRKTVACWMGCSDDEVVFTPGTTIWVNMLTAALARSKRIAPKSVIILSKWEHHANIVPWQILAEQTGAYIEWLDVNSDGRLHYEQLEALIAKWSVSLVAIQSCSNVTGAITDLERVRGSVWDDVILVVDASQSTPHYSIDLESVSPDFLFWTGHKIGAYTGCGVMYGKKRRLSELQPWWWWWGAIENVTIEGHTYQWAPDKFEPGTPNLIGAVSMAAAIRYIESIGGYEVIASYEHPMTEYCLERIQQLEKYDLYLVGPTNAAERIGVFSFASETYNLHSLWQRLSDEGLAIRVWGQCAHPFHESLGNEGTLRMSLWITNEIEDCVKFFDVLEGVLSNN